MLKLCVFFIFVGGLTLVGQETGKTRLLTPRSDSSTAMRNCGAELESVKADHSLNRRYVFTGEEILSGMQYCVEGKHALTDDKHTYRVPAGTIGGLSDDGQMVVLEQCVNMAQCAGCPPIESPSPASEPTPEPKQPAEKVTLPPEKPRVELNELPPALDWPTSVPYQVTLTWDAQGRPLWSKFPVLNCVYQFGPNIKHDWKKVGPDVERGLCVAGGVFGGLAASGGSVAAVVGGGSKVTVPVPGGWPWL